MSEPDFMAILQKIETKLAQARRLAALGMQFSLPDREGSRA
jgi:hypothetical protein